jgi:hypothetical protein
LARFQKRPRQFTVSRIPVDDSEAPEAWTGIIFTRDILSAMAQDRFDAPIESLRLSDRCRRDPDELECNP